MSEIFLHFRIRRTILKPLEVRGTIGTIGCRQFVILYIHFQSDANYLVAKPRHPLSFLLSISIYLSLALFLQHLIEKETGDKDNSWESPVARWETYCFRIK